jgi:hypothetical protein
MMPSPPTIATSRSLVVGSDARCRRLHDRVREAVGGVTADDLESLLGDYRSPDASASPATASCRR